MGTDPSDDQGTWPGTTRLCAGRIQVQRFDDSLRHFSVDRVEIFAALYTALRAEDWSAIPLDLVHESLTESAGSLTLVRDEALGSSISSRWEVRVTADRLDATVELRVHRRCQLNRWGFNVCLDAEDYAGASAGRDGEHLPVDIGPQVVSDGVMRGLFPADRRLVLRRRDGLEVALVSDTLVLEVEDQRNWTDASFKVYSGSLADPWPMDLRPGQVRRQHLAVSWQSLPVRPQGDPPRLTLGPLVGLPAVGVQANDGAAPPGVDGPQGPPTSTRRELLDVLQPNHVRLDIEPGDGSGSWAVPRYGRPIELAALLATTDDAILDRLADLSSTLPDGSRVLLHLDERRTTDRHIAETVQRRIDARGARVSTCPGTDVYWMDLNRDRPDVSGGPVSFSITPTVHLADSESLFASLPIQEFVVRESRDVLGANAVVVSPVTLRLRGRPEVDSTDRSARHAVEPVHVDPRLHTMEGAAWTIGSVCALTAGGAVSGTWHELVGPRGLVDVTTVPFFSPTFHALAALGADRRPRVQVITSSDRSVAGFWFPDDHRAVLASLRPWLQVHDLRPLAIDVLSRQRLRGLDLAAAGARADWWGHAEVDGLDQRALDLEPFEVVQLVDLPSLAARASTPVLRERSHMT